MESTLVNDEANSQARAEAAFTEDDPPALMIDERGMISDCNRAGELLFGYRRSEVVWRHISMLLPQMYNIDLLCGEQINPRLRFLCHIGRPFDTLNRRGEHFASALFVNDLGNPGPHRLRVIVRAVGRHDEQQIA